MLISLAGVAVRCVRLDHPMRYDESYSFFVYVAENNISQIFHYTAPNNHVLHTILESLSFNLFGMQPWALRLPAFVAGAALIPAAALLARYISGSKVAGLIAAVLVASSSFMIEYSVNARGYSLICLLAVLQMWLALRLLAEDPASLRQWIAWSAVTAAGFFAVPVMAYPTAVCILIFILQTLAMPSILRWRLWRNMALACLGAAALTLLLYAPVVALSGLDAVIANRFVAPKPFPEVWNGLVPMLGTTASVMVQHVPVALQVLGALGLACALVFGIRKWRVVWLLPILGPLFLMAIILGQRVLPAPRMLMPMWPLTLVIAACGLAVSGEWLGAWRQRWMTVLCLSVVGLSVVGAWRCLNEPFLISEDPQTPVYAQTIVREVVNEGLYDGKSALVCDWNVLTWPPFIYYVASQCPPGQPAPFAPTDSTERVFLPMVDQQDVEGVSRCYPVLKTSFGPPELWKTIHGCRIFVVRRVKSPL